MSSKAERGHARRVTGRRGESQIEDFFLSMGLLPRHEMWDEGEDLNLEFKREGDRWDRIFVQVKSSTRRFGAGRRDVWPVRLSAKAVARYRRATQPVVLVAIDLESKEVRWDDLSVLATTEQSVTVPLDSSKELKSEDAPAFVKRLLALADRKRAQIVPPQRALADEEAWLNALDPRLKVRVTASSDGIQHEISGNESSPVLTLGGEVSPEGAAQLDDHKRFGVPAVAEFRQFSLSGSPVAEAYGISEQAFLEIYNPGESYDVELGWLDEGGAFQFAVQGQAKVYRGQDGAEMRLVDEALPLRMTLRRVDTTGTEPMRATVEFHFGPWDGHAYRELPWWDGVYALWRALAAGQPLALARRVWGRRGEPMNLGNDGDTRSLAEAAITMLGPLPVVVEAARRFDLDARWREGGIAHSEQVRWEKVSRLLAGRAVALPPPRWRVEADGSQATEQVVPVIHFPDTIELPLMGTSIGTLPVIWRLTDYRFEHTADGGALMPQAHSQAHVVLWEPTWSTDEACSHGCDKAVEALASTT